MMQILMTGFGPFGSVVDNPTERLLRQCAAYPAATGRAGHGLTVCALPTSFERAPQVFQTALEKGGHGGRPFDVVLMLGVAASSDAWRVETQGLNYDKPAIPDIDGCLPIEREIVPGGPSCLPVTLPTGIMQSALETIGLPVLCSDSAGQYLCNHLLYTALHTLQKRLPACRAGFLHVPPDEHTFGANDLPATAGHLFSFARHVEAIRAILDACALLPPIPPHAEAQATASVL